MHEWIRFLAAGRDLGYTELCLLIGSEDQASTSVFVLILGGLLLGGIVGRFALSELLLHESIKEG